MREATKYFGLLYLPLSRVVESADEDITHYQLEQTNGDGANAKPKHFVEEVEVLHLLTDVGSVQSGEMNLFCVMGKSFPSR